MSEWRPIAEYDAMKKKPRHVVFYFESTARGRNYLPACLELSRSFGRRVCTHYFVLPELPKPQESK